MPHTLLNLRPLYRHCVFRSDEAVRSHDLAARELADHTLRWRAGAVDSAMYKAQAGRLEIFALRYGAEVDITPRPSNDFAVVHYSVQGTAEVIADGQCMVLPQGRTGWMAPRKSWRMRWQQGSEQLIIKVPRDMLHAGDGKPLLPLGALPEAFNTQWLSLLQSLVGASSMSEESAARGSWVDYLEHAVALFLLTHSVSVPMATPMREWTTTSQRSARRPTLDVSSRLGAMEHYMQTHLGAPAAPVDLAGAAGVSVRVLQILCQRHYGVAPMDLLRNMRLDAVRTQLLERLDANITQTALEFGFSHLGRFSSYYRKRFGELPSATRSARH
jgi:AraC-like DNA-binding protein